MDDLKLRFERRRTVITPFTEKAAMVLRTCLCNTRFNKDFNFEGFGNIIFNKEDSEFRENPIVTNINKKFNKSDCLVFSMYDTFKNPGIYDTMVIYQTIGKEFDNFGIVFYNTKNDVCLHKYYLTHDITEFLNFLNVLLYRIELSDYIKKFMHRKD